MTDDIIFEAISERRGWYRADYEPPNAQSRFATLNLVVTKDEDATDLNRVAEAMEQELVFWLGRYDVALMVSAFDPTGNLISLETAKSSSHLMGHRASTAGKVVSVWGSLPDDAMPPLNAERLKTLYPDIPYREMSDIRAKADQNTAEQVREIRLINGLLILWLVIIPVCVAILGFADPIFGALVLVYSLWKGVVQWMKLRGNWPDSPTTKVKRQKEARMRHYFHHCEKNPSGFSRLRAENFEREERERIGRL
jgi:hypothetical protein